MFPADVFVIATLWQLTTTVAVYGLFCHLLNLQFSGRESAEKKLRDIHARTRKSDGVTLAANSALKGGAGKKSKHFNFAFGMIAILGFFSALSSDQIFSRTSAQFLFDPPTGRVMETPIRGHGSAVDNVVKDTKLVVLTIDDGPSNSEIDLRLLEILRKHSAPSIWFVNCSNFDDASNPKAARNLQVLHTISNAGHMIGNHSYSHKDLRTLDRENPDKLRFEIAGCSDAIDKATGKRPTYFRGPWGQSAPHVVAMAEKNGMRIMNWTANSNDTSFYGRSEPYREFLFNSPDSNFADTVKNGDIVLLHDQLETAEILDQFLTNLEKRGFHFVLPS
jgi:peptidoglycan/xylan/chitin deacetylase (PgdA/CDA1 family)